MRARKRAKKIDLTVNKLDRETFDLLSAEQISPQELWFITSADSVVVDIDKIGQGGGGGHDYGPEISELSANKRDYTDLTYNQDHLALESQLSAYVTSAWVMNYVNDQISAALNAQL